MSFSPAVILSKSVNYTVFLTLQRATNLTEAGQDKIYNGIQQFFSNDRHLAMQSSYDS